MKSIKNSSAMPGGSCRALQRREFPNFSSFDCLFVCLIDFCASIYIYIFFKLKKEREEEEEENIHRHDIKKSQSNIKSS